MEEKDKFVAYINEELKEIVPIFIEGKYRDIEKLLKYLEDQDFESIKRLGHNMKGTAGGYGFKEIMEIGIEIEKLADEKKSSALKIKVDELSNYLNNLEIIYESME